jgi:hypothetical protein
LVGALALWLDRVSALIDILTYFWRVRSIDMRTFEALLGLAFGGAAVTVSGVAIVA